MSVLDRELKTVIEELDPKKTGFINYQYFLDSVYLTQMYIHEMELYNALKEADKDGQNGVTITEVKSILKNNPKFQFPDEALGAAFKAMLGADINDIEPDCIIDTEKFVASLHKEFEAISQRSLSQIK
jgi:Ca2+-binding EF-hand superfamily protein